MSDTAHARTILLAGGCMSVAALGLAVGLSKPPVGLCDPVVSAGAAGIALAQALVLIGVVLLRRDLVSGVVAGLLVASMSLISGAVLAVRAGAGHPATLSVTDIVHAAVAALALGLLLGGLSAKLASARPVKLALGASVAALAGLAATALMDARAHDKMWISWARVNEASAALETAPVGKDGLPRGENVPLAGVLAEFPADAVQGIPVMDAWGDPLIYRRQGAMFSITSQGADGEPGPYSDGPSRDLKDDVAIENGIPVAWPESPCSGEERKAPRPRPVDLRSRPRRP